MGNLIAVIAEEGEDWQKVASDAESLSLTAASQSSNTPDNTQETESKATETPSKPAAPPSAAGSQKIGPAIRLVLQSHNVNSDVLGKISGTGAGGKVVKRLENNLNKRA